MRGRGVEEDIRHVLAAHQVDVIDAQVHRGDFVAAAPDGALPLDHLGPSAPQPVSRGEEGAPVSQAA